MLKFRDIELDDRVFELRRGGRAVAVQRRVLDMIFFLARHRDRMVTKDELLAGPWGGVQVGDAALSRAICEARRALGDDAQKPSVIFTVRGKGFRFKAPPSEVFPTTSVTPSAGGSGK